MKENWSSRMNVDSKAQMMNNCFQVKRNARSSAPNYWFVDIDKNNNKIN